QPRVQSLEPRVLLTVNPTGVTIAPTETMDFTGTVASFTSNQFLPIDFLATIDWGDGTTSEPGTVTSNGSGGFNVTGTHAYGEDGSDTISVVIQDQFDESTATATSTALVAEATTGEGAFSASDGGTITTTEGQALSAAQVATFLDT